MKHTKRLRHMKGMLAILLACVVIAALSTTVYATAAPTNSSTVDADNGSITIENPREGVTYTAYLIFNATYTAGGSNYSYSIAKDSKWLDTVQDYAAQTDSKLALIPTSAGTAYTVNIETGFSAAAFAKYLSEHTPTDATGVEINTPDGTKLKVEDLPLGYYFVKGDKEGLCNLTTTDPDAVIRDKNDVPFDKTVSDKAPGETGGAGNPAVDGVEVGQIVYYSIDGKVPDTTGFDQYIYQATDTMAAGLTLNKDVKVTIGTGSAITPTEATAETDLAAGKILYQYDGSRCSGFILRLDMVGQTANADVKITYSATVNEAAVKVISENKAVLQYGNDPNDLTDSVPSQVKVFSSEIDILKYEKQANETDKSKLLAGAEFVLKNSKTVEGEDGEEVVEGDKYYHKDETTGAVTWVGIEDATKVTTGADGKAVFPGLANGTYYLIETKAPDGYHLMQEAKQVVVESSIVQVNDKDTPNPKDFTYNVDVPNENGTLLPSTGGIGTTIFYVAGGALILAAVLGFVISRRGRRAGAEGK